MTEFSVASRKSRESHTNSIRAGEIATNAADVVDRFRGQLSQLSEELSRYTVSFNSTLFIIQDIAITAAAQDEIMNELRTGANAQAALCIQKVNISCCMFL